MKNKLFFILTSPLFLSIVLTTVLFIALPPLFLKYKIDLIKKIKTGGTSPIEYCDLNNDGFSEKITIVKSYSNRTGIIVLDKGEVIDHWNFNGIMAMSSLFYDDFNNDGLKEIFLFTIFENKILLNCFNPYENKKYITDKYIADFYPKNGEKSCVPHYIELLDLNNDKKKELVFAFSTGYSLYPRKFFYYNFEKSGESGNNKRKNIGGARFPLSYPAAAPKR